MDEMNKFQFTLSNSKNGWRERKKRKDERFRQKKRSNNDRTLKWLNDSAGKISLSQPLNPPETQMPFPNVNAFDCHHHRWAQLRNKSNNRISGRVSRLTHNKWTKQSTISYLFKLYLFFSSHSCHFFNGLKFLKKKNNIKNKSIESSIRDLRRRRETHNKYDKLKSKLNLRIKTNKRDKDTSLLISLIHSSAMWCVFFPPPPSSSSSSLILSVLKSLLKIHYMQITHKQINSK